MYRCKECNTEYETKPEYCDCGNDTFEEIIVNQNIVQPQPEKPECVTIEQETEEKTILARSIEKTVSKNTSALEPYAIITFAICIILSLIIILFVANPKQNELTEIKQNEVKTTENIPSIETLWNNSTEGISNYQPKTETKPEQTETKKKVELTQPVKVTTPITTKKIASPLSQKLSVKPNKTTPSTSLQKNSQQTSQQITKKIETKVNPQELANYKIKLRNYIASKIAFTSVVGDGTCSFSFKISDNGVLTNKKPSKLSDNDSLNEAVYNALKQVYSYNTPPTGYKNETLKLTVKMYNNSFEVYLD